LDELEGTAADAAVTGFTHTHGPWQLALGAGSLAHPARSQTPATAAHSPIPRRAFLCLLLNIAISLVFIVGLHRCR